MTRREAAALLGCTPDAAAVTVRECFRTRATMNHPDHGGSGVDMARLREARDLLLTDRADNVRCASCNDTGWVGIGFVRSRCPRGC